MSVSDAAILQGAAVADFARFLGPPEYCRLKGRDLPSVNGECARGATWIWSGSDARDAQMALGGELFYECAVTGSGACTLRVTHGE
jgi:hypothetical protein